MTEHNKKSDVFSLITVGITCFNAEKTIKRAIKSALNQSWPNIEIIIINDCSTDNSLKAISKCVDKHRNLIVINHEVNKGCAASRNRITHESKGEFIAFFDDDDSSHEDRLKTQYQRILEYENKYHVDMVACYCSGIRYYPNGYKMPFRAIGSQTIIPKGLMVVDYLLMFKKRNGVFYGGGTPANSMMARLDIFKKVGDFDIVLKRQEDADFAIRLAFMGGHFIGTAEFLIEQYATISHDKTSLIEYESSLNINIKNKIYLEGCGLYDYMMKWIKLRHYYHSNRIFKALPVIFYMLINHPVKFAGHFFVSGTKRMAHDMKINKIFLNANIFF